MRLDAADAEQLAVHVGDRRHAAVARIQLRPVELEHLDLDAVGQPRLRVRVGVAPDEDAGVAARLDVLPLDVQHEVLVLLLAAHHADRAAGADQQAVLHAPGVVGGVDVDPPGEVAAVEQIAEFVRDLRDRPRRGEKNKEKPGDERPETVAGHGSHDYRPRICLSILKSRIHEEGQFGRKIRRKPLWRWHIP